VVTIISVAAIYVFDYVWLRYRMASNGSDQAFGSVPVQPLLAVPLKGGKIEFDVDQAVAGKTQPCVHSLFSHAGYRPCWYVTRENRSPIPMILLR
jgi:hypothetical protein